MAKSKIRLDEDRLIAERIDPEWDRYGGPADARTREGVPVWALVSHLRLTDGDADATAAAYGLPRASVEAAQSYYRRNAPLVDARILLNTA